MTACLLEEGNKDGCEMQEFACFGSEVQTCFVFSAELERNRFDSLVASEPFILGEESQG